MDFHNLKYLFLDRDGVLNRRIPDDYVRSFAQWEWLPKAKEALSILAVHFEVIVITSNQQGVGKGLFTTEDLLLLTDFFLLEIHEYGGRIDKVYYCTHLKKEECACRKPRTGMAFMAVRDFPQLDFSSSIMVGDTISDMEFGKKCGMKTAYIATEKTLCLEEKEKWADACFDSLYAFALLFQTNSL